MDPGWDHTENEDKLLLTHTLGMGHDMATNVDSVVYASEFRTVSGIGCNNNTSNDLNIVMDTRFDYNNYFSSVVINNINVLCLRIVNSLNFDFDEICSLINWFNFWISRISKICNSNCKCTFKCEPPCTKNTICLCLCECTKPEANGCCVCICKKDTCECICICVCKKGDQCCCLESKTHECKECLVKVNLSTLLRYNCTILRCLNFIKCCLRNHGTINYESIFSRIHSIESCFDYVETIIGRLQKFKNILSPISLIASKCKSCGGDCCNKIEDLIDIISISCRYFYRIKYELKDIRTFVYYKMFYPKSNEIIEKLKISVKPLLNQLDEINSQIINYVYHDRMPNNLLISVMSGIVIDESIFILSTVYMYYKTKDLIDETLQILDRCICFRIYNRDWRDKIETFDKPLSNINKKTWNDQMVSDILDHIYNKSRYVCICLFIRYKLLYDLNKINNKYNEIYMDLLSCMSRSYNKYSYSMRHNFNLSMLIMLIITTLDKIIRWMNNIYIGEKIHCYCYDINNSYYPYLISIILYVSSMVENIWSMDTETIRMTIECVSSLLVECQSLDDKSHYTVIEPLEDSKIYMRLSVHNSGTVYTLPWFLDFQIDIKYTISLFGDIFSMCFKFDIFSFDSRSIFVLAYNYFFNITFSFDNILHIFKKTFNLVILGIHEIISEFLLIISKVKFKSILKDCDCNKKCGKKLIMKNSVELMYNRCILITKNISKDMRLDTVIPSSMSKNITINKLNHMMVKYIRYWMVITKNKLITHPNYDTNNIRNIGVTNVETRNWGYDTKYEHDVTNDKGFRRGDGYPNLLSDPRYTFSHLPIFP